MYKLIMASFCLLFFWACSTSPQEQADSEEKGIQDIDVQVFKSKMHEKDIVVLDVRTPREIRNGKIANALEINVNGPDFESKIAELDKSKTYLVYCAAGLRSQKACKKMEAAGFKKLYNLESGYTGWKAAGN